jgi:hypothetical protein
MLDPFYHDFKKPSIYGSSYLQEDFKRKQNLNRVRGELCHDQCRVTDLAHISCLCTDLLKKQANDVRALEQKAGLFDVVCSQELACLLVVIKGILRESFWGYVCTGPRVYAPRADSLFLASHLTVSAALRFVCEYPPPGEQ